MTETKEKGCEPRSENPALFVDMDGTLAEWKTISLPVQIPVHKIMDYIQDTLYQEHYYWNLKPYANMVQAITDIIKEGKIDVYILSCFLPEHDAYPNSHPLKDKNDWLDAQFPGLIPQNHRIFVQDGEPKVENIPFPLRHEDVLLDDFTKNLDAWVNDTTQNVMLKGIKVLNGINDSHQSWKGARVSIFDVPGKIKQDIYANF